MGRMFIHTSLIEAWVRIPLLPPNCKGINGKTMPAYNKLELIRFFFWYNAPKFN